MNRIKELRNEKKIKQDTLAKLLGLEIAGISKLETGRVPLKDEYIIKLAKYFEVTTDYLLGKSDDKNQNYINENDKISYGLLKYYNKLNTLGKKRALENIQDLAEIPKYTVKKSELQKI